MSKPIDIGPAEYKINTLYNEANKTYMVQIDFVWKETEDSVTTEHRANASTQVSDSQTDINAILVDTGTTLPATLEATFSWSPVAITTSTSILFK